MTLRSWMVDRFFRAEVDQRMRLAIPVRDDAPGYRAATTPLLQQNWSDVRSLIEAATTLGRTHPLAARILALTTDFVVGAGPEVTGDDWALAFWHDPHNCLDARLHRWCDELARTGELFLALSRNPANGMSYVREVPACPLPSYALGVMRANSPDSNVICWAHSVTLVSKSRIS
jgi:hypothetical protein